MRISSKAHYGLQAAYILARDGKVVSAKELEREIGVSCKYLERIMRILTGAGIVSANRGTAGGYFLASSADQITVGRVVRALEDELEIVDCVKTEACFKCASSAVWKKLYNGINAILDGITLSDMLEEGEISHVGTCTECLGECGGSCFSSCAEKRAK